MLGVQSKIITKQLKICISKFYGGIDLRVIVQSAHRIKSFFHYKDRINRSQMSIVVYKASCWDFQDFFFLLICKLFSASVIVVVN